MLAGDAGQAVDQDEGAEDHAGALQRAEADHDREHREQQDALHARFVKLARMARQLRRVVGEDHRPGQARVRGAAPQFAVDEIGDSAEQQPDRGDGGGDVAKRQDRDLVAIGKPHHRDDAAEEAAMERHAAFPQFEDRGGMIDEEGQVVEQHVAGAAAEDDAERDPQDEVVDLHQRDRRRSAPQALVLQERARIEPAEHDAADIGQRIPADREWTDLDRDRLEGGKVDQQKGHRAFYVWTRLRRRSTSSGRRVIPLMQAR